MHSSSVLLALQKSSCYDHEDIPRTSNGHEHMYGRLRGNERRITGHKSTSRTVRDGRFTAPVIERMRRGDIRTPEALALVSPEEYNARLEEMKRARERHARPREITKRFDEVLKGLASHDPDTRPRPAAAGFLDRMILPP